MTAHRKVRKDFDPKQSISVDVSNCTVEEKKEVQQAFYDVGIKWESGVLKCRYLTASLYTNSTKDGAWYDHLMYGTLPRTDSISRQQFLSMVYEPEQQGHVHAELMLQYAQDAMTTTEPWKLWQVQDGDFGGPKGEWRNLEEYSNLWIIGKNYRRKPIAKLIHGVEVPDISFTPEDNEYYFYPDPTKPCMYEMEYFHNYAEECGHRLTNKMCYPTTDEGREAATLHAKAMLGVQP